MALLAPDSQKLEFPAIQHGTNIIEPPEIVGCTSAEVLKMNTTTTNDPMMAN